MSKGTLEEIETHISEIAPKIEATLEHLEKECIKGRDRSENPIPIYLTKWRVKKPNSVYLKTKRKNENFKRFTDYGGLRLLCLFEQDIVRVYDFFLEVLKENNYQLKECYGYNWDGQSDQFFVLNKITEKTFPGYSLRPEKKLSGYKSIHCLVVTKEDLIIEVQLRTLVQDVWSELEHTLSYKKGSVHPHIKKSFSLLSKDLENIDELFSHLRDISDKEKGGKTFSNHKIGPKCHFEYEDELFPKKILINDITRDIYNKYWDFIADGKKNGYDIDFPWFQEAKKELEKLKDALKSQESDPTTTYWLDMEDAFILFCETKYDESIAKYTEIKNNTPDRYCVYYRLGELYFIKEESEMALNYFDKSETLLEKSEKHNTYNHFLIKSRLALTYWSLGDEYIDISIQEALAAKELYDQSASSENFSKKDKLVITNSLCWYYLERYIIAKRKDDKKRLDGYFTDAKLRFEELNEFIAKENDFSLGVLDTLMWYHFYKYKRTKNETDLVQAKRYALQMKGKANQNISFRIMNMHINHIQEVMQYAYDVLGEGNDD